ncbi:Lipase [Trema orientale]|uniref:Lipase n=1 Tax=Trema orientale TaxID=63057 RepID=A0A2P5CNB8_TREOI|nr:Lipase [Trema orientale]
MCFKEIYKIGGRKFGFQSVRPIACVPYARVLAAKKYNESCLDQTTPFVQLHNAELSKLLQKLNSKLKGFRYSFSDYYTFLKERMDHPSIYGRYEYVFFDSAHPTEKAYQQFAEQAWSAQPSLKGSYNLKELLKF